MITSVRRLASGSAVLSVALALLVSGCLKTRAQLREEAGDIGAAGAGAGAPPIPAQVQEVQPQGQYVIDEIKSEITRLTGRIEDLERAQKDSAGSHGAQEAEAKQETRIAELEKAQADMIEAIKKMQLTLPAAESPELFEQGKNQFETGNFESAIENLSAYLKNPKAKKTEEATFLRGEAYYASQQYNKAIVDFSRFPDAFRKSKRTPAALLRIGQSFEALGMKKESRDFYQELVDTYPKSAEAKKVKGKLK